MITRSLETMTNMTEAGSASQLFKPFLAGMGAALMTTFLVVLMIM
jgi:hypothetical protein